MSKAKTVLVLAMSKNGVIGDDNQLPWNLPSDLKRFKGTTIGHPIVMGRKTFESIGRPLPGRDNIVLTRSGRFEDDNVHAVSSLEEGLALAQKFADQRGVDEIMIIGGGDVFEQTRGDADKIHLTIVDLELEGDTVFSPLEPDIWNLVSSQKVSAGPKDTADFVAQVFERIKQ